MSSKKTPLYAKILLSVFSLLFFLTVLEIGLWTIGRMYYERDQEYRTDEAVGTSAAGGETIDIIAVGDSFTHGGLVNGRETYTAHLRELLSQHQVNSVRVYNQGICELNTYELLQRFPDMISKYNPKAVLLLAGATNRFNPWDYEAATNKSFLSVLKSWFFDRRVVKMVRFIKLSMAAHEGNGTEFQKEKLIMRYLQPKRSIKNRHDTFLRYFEHLQEGINKSGDLDPMKQAWYLFNHGDQKAAIEIIERSLQNNQIGHADGLYLLIHFYYKSDNLARAEELLQENYQKNPRTELVYSSLAYFYIEFANWYKKNMKYDKAIDYYLQAIAFEPDADFFFYELNKLYDMQSHYDSKVIYQKLQAMRQKNPLLALSQHFTHNLKLYKDKQKWESGIEQWIYDDLKVIARMCQRKNIRLFIQLYPTDYVMANRALEKVAKEYRLPVIDHQSVFKPLEPKSKYFFDDDHCTNEGHKIMARTIYNSLAKENVFQ